MGKQKRFTLRPEWLAHLLNKTAESMSLFAPDLGTTETLNPEDMGSLKSEGVLDADGNITSEAKEALNILAQARAVARVRISGGEGFIENSIYLGKAREQWVLLVNESPNLILRYPVTPREVLREARELMGQSILSGIAWEENLTVNEALLLSAIVDSARKQMLSALAQDIIEINPILDKKEVLEWALAPGSNAQWLTVVVKGLIPEQDAKNDLGSALLSLAAKGLIKVEDTRIIPEAKTALLASRLLVIDKLFSLRAIYQTSEGPAQISFLAVQGGVNDVLMMECNGTSVRFTGVSPADVLETAEIVIQNLAVISEAVPSEQQEKLQTKGKPLCPSCQAEIVPQAKFCPFCGTPLR